MQLVDRLIHPKPRDVGFPVRRLLPAAAARSVGPFVFLDHMGPARFAPASTAGDVLAHPHIGLATVTYLFSGAMVHRDSLGTVQRIEPGDVNWMTAGRGIVHSERVPEDVRAAGTAVDGIQMWVALPREEERAEPAFWHHPVATLPQHASDGVRLRLLAGALNGLSAPARTYSPMFYAALELDRGARLRLDPAYPERALYLAAGRVAVLAADTGRERSHAAQQQAQTSTDPQGQVTVEAGTLGVLQAGAAVMLHALAPTRAMLLGGAPLDGRRHMWWNFVASDASLIEAARADWAADRFAPIPGETGRMPLPSR